MIELDRLSVELGGRRILEEVAVSLDARRIAVVGANGSGKSTFARVIGGLVPPSSGAARVHGIDVMREPRDLRRTVGIVFTNPDAQLLMPTVAEDLRFSLRGMGLSRREIDERVADCLPEFGLSSLADAACASLSGGQKQLVALAAVLIRRPRLLIADEPTTLLDLENSRRIGDLLMESTTPHAVIVTHDLELAGRCDVALRFRDGRLIACGDPGEIISAYRQEHGQGSLR